MKTRVRSSSGFAFRVVVGLALLIGLTTGSAAAETRMHHIGLGFGYSKLLSDDLDPDRTFGLDFTDCAMGGLSYRISISRTFDAVFDSRSTFSRQEALGDDVHFTTSWFGPGLRIRAAEGNIRPYAQANFYFAQEEFSIDSGSTTTSTDESGVGFGFFSGVDIRVSRLISIPVEIAYLYADPEDNISSFGGGAGVTFNFGKVID
ncbi:MAG: outer membrane beta-barrel protein [Candidatus Eiseniibacteriota bacterium]